MSEDERWLEMTVEDDRATARVGGSRGVSDPFPFSFVHLGYVARGMGYQAWGGGSHFAFRSQPEGFSLEFQGPDDHLPAVVELSQDAMRSAIDRLDAFAPRASLL